MITFVRNFEVKTGKMPEALALAQEAMGHVKDAYGVEVDVYTPIGGNPLRITLAAEYDDMGAVEDIMEKLAEDASWTKTMQSAADLVVEDSVVDEFWKKT
ncbi:MAG: NIPSNAP family protein [Rhodospirillales bacterium]|nr:NIPSNAP family protein [Rhodospirillales bacterium]